MSEQHSKRVVVYRPIPGHTGYYADEGGGVWTDRPSPLNPKGVFKRLRAATHRKGYRVVNLGSKARNRLIHRLILETFVGPCPPGKECCHGNRDRSDNRLSNLRWGTPEENAADSIRHGTRPRGGEHPNAKLTEGDVARARTLRGEGWSARRIAEALGVSKYALDGALCGRTWRHVPQGGAA